MSDTPLQLREVLALERIADALEGMLALAKGQADAMTQAMREHAALQQNG